MTKQEFLDILKRSLEGEINPIEVRSNIEFYDNFIESELRSGKRIDDIMNQLGDPRLIARTIIETSKISKSATDTSQKYYDDTYNNYKNDSNDSFDSGRKNKGFQMHYSMGDKVPIRHKLLGILTVICILFFVLILARIAIRLFFTIGLPILLVYLAYSLIIKRRR
jgi:Flp pilus assembly protein TadB